MWAARRSGGRLEGHRHDGPMSDVGASVLRWLAPDAREDPLPGADFVG
jgi:hypothetical protein